MANWPRRNRAVSIDYDVAIPMRDGTRLQADVFRPAGAGRVPVILLRTPYDRQLGSGFALQINAVQLAAAGYAVVVQDTRGRFGSGGDFSPFVHEARDGFDSIAWCADRSWSNGRVGMAGSSYLGFAQVLAAREQPEALKAWVPALTTIDARTAWVYEGGALCLGFDLSWALGMMVADPRTRNTSAVLDALGNWPATVRMPIVENPLFDQPSGQFLRDWIDRKDDADYWAAQSGIGIDMCAAPALQIGGWYDLFHLGTFRLHEALANGAARDNHRFVMGPWDHSGYPLGTGSGNVDFGPRATFDLNGAQRDWFDWLLRDESEPDWPKNRMFLTGTNQWETFDTWPPRFDVLDLHLGPGGTLTDIPASEGLARFEADADDPAPALGGRMCCAPYLLPVGSRWQNARAERPDVLRFQTDTVTKPWTLLGPITAEIWSTSDRNIGDVHVTLVDIDARNGSRYLGDGIARLELTPGEPARFMVDLGQIGHVVMPGHRLGVDIAAVSFPRFDLAPAEGTSQRAVVFGSEFRSRITIGVA